MSDRFARSRELHQRACASIAGGVNSNLRRHEQPVPLYFTHGTGARLWDVDGNEYVDFQLGQGALLFGHAPAGQAETIAQQAKLGVHWAAQSELEIAVAERLQRLLPSAERVRFSSSATEVVLTACRLARAHTGRPLILKFEGHYHGWADEGPAGFAPRPDAWGAEEAPNRTHPSQGVIGEVLDRFVVARWNAADHLRRRVREFRGQIAAILFEPVACNAGCIEPAPGLFGVIRELCDAEGALMIADEAITGFRFGAGGAQAHYGFRPDLTILGKALGGGVPFAALAGRAEVFARIVSGQVVHGGTLNGNPLCLAASQWCLDQISALGAAHPRPLNELGRSLMAGLRALADRHQVPLRPQGPGLVFHTVLLQAGAAEGPVRDYRDHVRRHDEARWTHLRLCLLQQGIRAIERGLWYVSLAHTPADIEETLRRADAAFARHAAEWRPGSR